MAQAKYSHAPVSEVIIGITWENDHLLKTGRFFSILQQLKEGYGEPQTLGPIADEALLPDGRVQQFLNPQNSGPLLYRFRALTADWLVQIQHNKVYLNWVRVDKTPVGHYPGYVAISEKFFGLLTDLGLADLELSSIQTLDLTYQDRLKWVGQIETLGDVDEIMGIKMPRLTAEKGALSKSLFLSSHYALPALKGFGTVQVQSPSPVGPEILSVQLSLKGKPDVGVHEWLNDAHTMQLEFFESFFHERILDAWRKQQ